MRVSSMIEQTSTAEISCSGRQASISRCRQTINRGKPLFKKRPEWVHRNDVVVNLAINPRELLKQPRLSHANDDLLDEIVCDATGAGHLTNVEGLVPVRRRNRNWDE